MIYTITFNPSLDYIVKVDDFELGAVNRTISEQIYSGGKGINVSIMLKRLGIDNVALGFIAGFTGTEIEQSIKRVGCNTDFIIVDNGISRINIKLKSKNLNSKSEESEINGQGPLISDNYIKDLFLKLDKLKVGDILVLAGSTPNTLPEDMYENILKYLENKNIQIVVDATKDLLLNVLKYHPFLIKPNTHELGDMFNTTLYTKEDVVFYAKKLQDKGARNVLVSMAGDGAVFVSEKGEVHKSEAPKGKVKNSVGAGDSMIAGFLTGYLKNSDYMEAFKMGLAAGSASAFSEDLATKEDVLNLLDTI